MAETDDLMPQAGLARPPDPIPADPLPAAEGEATAAPAAKPVPAKPVLVPAGAPRKSQGDLAAIAGQLMIDRVRRLMAVSKDLGTAAAQLETLTASILTGGAAAATAPPDPGKLEVTHFFLALDLLLVRIEERSQRVAVQAARLDRLFDLDVKPSAQAS